MKRILSIILVIVLLLSLGMNTIAAYTEQNTADIAEDKSEQVVMSEGMDIYDESSMQPYPHETIVLHDIDNVGDVRGTTVASGSCGKKVRWSLDDEGTLIISGSGAMQDYTNYPDVPPWYSYRTLIKKLVVEENVTSIGGYAYYGCGDMTEATIPASVTRIGDYAFTSYNLTEVYYNGTPTQALQISFGINNYSLTSNMWRWSEGTFGICGDGLIATLSDEGILTISGTGEMTYRPWTNRNSDITSVVIENGVTSICSGAFGGCTSLSNASISESVTSIGANAFSGCTSLSIMTIPEGVTSIGNNAFDGCNNLARVTLPDGLTSIGSYAFWNCSSLIQINLPDSITYLGGSAFSNCSSLMGNIILPSGLSQIERGTFSSCSSLAGVTIGNGVAVIGDSAFSQCASLTDVVLPSSVTAIGGGAFSGCSSLTDIVIPDSVTKIEGSTFRFCYALENVSMPDSITSIGEYAFGYCYHLAEISIPNNVTSIGESAFINTALQSVAIPAGVTTIKTETFRGCSSLKTVYMPASVIVIAASAFNNDGNLTDVYYGGTNAQKNEILIASNNEPLENALWHCSDGFFGECGENLTWSLTPDGVLTISGTGEMTSSPWSSLKSYIVSVVIEDGVASIVNSAFSTCTNLTSVSIPDSVTSIGTYAFSNCTGLSSISLPDTLTDIAGSVFSGCVNLTSITIPDGVTSIGTYSFSGCGGLTAVSIPVSVASIDNYAFNNCGALTDVNYGGTYTQKAQVSIGSYNSSLVNARWHFIDGIEAGGSCGDALTWVLYDTGHLSISGTGDMYDYNSSTMPWYSNRYHITTVEIGTGVTGIGKYAFYGCVNMVNATISDTVTSINISAFRDCRSMKTINMPNQLIEISDTAFRGCGSLTEILLPTGLTRIGKSAFFECNSLSSISIPETVTMIESHAFDGCTSLTGGITIPSGASSICPGTFKSCSSLNSITIPYTVRYISDYAFLGCEQLDSVYYDDTEWARKLMSIGNNNGALINAKWHYSGNVHPVADGTCGEQVSWTLNSAGVLTISGIGDMKHYDPDYSSTQTPHPWYSYRGFISAVEIEDGVYNIGEYAFYKCSKIESVILAESVMLINECAFQKCSNLKSVTMTTSVRWIYSSAFESCGSLTDVYYDGTPEARRMISVYVSNGPLLNAHWHYVLGSGTCGEGLTWALNDDGILVISGTGAMSSFELGGEPWNEFVAAVTSVVIEDGVTAIGANAFSGCVNLGEITIPASVITISDGAFSECSSLTDVYYDGTIAQKEQIMLGTTNEPLLNAEWHYIIIPYELTYTNHTDGIATVVGVDNGGEYAGETSFTVDCAMTCLALCSKDGGTTYERLTATAAASGYNFTLDVDCEVQIVIVLVGDATLDGKVNTTDVTQMKRYIAGRETFNIQQILAGDVNEDGEINTTDTTQLKRYLANKRTFEW